jgi:amidase
VRLDEYARCDATDLAHLVRSNEVTAAELTRLARAVHDRVNPEVNAVIEFYDDAESVHGSDQGAFCGVPFLRKDHGLASEAGRLIERGSQLIEGARGSVDSHYIQRARDAGLRILGRTSMPEFGVSGFSESHACGVTRNPWNLDRTAGGSSAGSAAAVAAGIVPIASAADGGGSIRTPAANCGLVGLMPSRGRVSGGPHNQDSGFGRVRAFVLCRSVRDAAAALDVFSGAHPGDPFVIAPPERPYAKELGLRTDRLRIGVARSPWGDGNVEPDVRDAVQQTATQLEAMGHLIEEVPAPYLAADFRKVKAGLYPMGLMSLDASARALDRSIDETTVEPVNLELYRIGKRLPFDLAPEIFEGVRKICADVGEATKDFDLLLTPTMPCTALPHGTYSTTNEALTVDELLDAETTLYQYLGVFNLTGHPAVSLPLFLDTHGMPIGVQLVGRFGAEGTLVRVARDLEEAVPWAASRPPVHAGNAG